MRSDIVRVVRAAFAAGGAARLIAWLALSGRPNGLDPFYAAVHDLVATLEPGAPVNAEGQHARVARLTAALLMLALGDGIVGDELAAALDLAPGVIAAVFADMLGKRP